MKTSRELKIGHYGESIASIYLKNKGYSVLARNVRVNEGEVRGEIDILVVKDRVLHVVEVKTACEIGLRDVIFVPESNLSKMKIRKLRKLRSVLMMRMSEGEPLLGGEISIKKSNPSISKVVITGIAVTLYMNSNWRDCDVGSVDITNNLVKEYLQCIKVRVFHDL